MSLNALMKRPLSSDNAGNAGEVLDQTGSSKRQKSAGRVLLGDKENKVSASALPRGLYNESNTCYLNSLVQVLLHLHPFRDLVFELTHNRHSQKLSVLEALQWLFVDLEEGTENGELVTTNRLTKAFGWTSINRGLQQDIHEFMQTLFNYLEKELQTDDFQQLSSIFTGTLQRCITCDKVGYESTKTEEIRGLSIPTISYMDIERSLHDVLKSEQIQMTIDGHGKQTAEMVTKLIDLPKVLLLTLNRLKYDPAEQAVVKVTDYFEYKEKLELCGHVYRLHSAVVHNGTAESGHYYCYISPTCDNRWYMFNDADVTHSDVKSAIRDNYGKKTDPGGPTAYLVTYVRDDCTEFFRPPAAQIPEKLRERIQDIRRNEKARLERIHTAHLYTTISLVSWAMLQSYSGYDVCDRVELDKLHKNGEGAVAEGIHNLRVLKCSTFEELMAQHDPSITEANARLWSFTDHQISDGWETHRPDKLIKDWKTTVAVASMMRCPFYVFVERLGLDHHPPSLKDYDLSLFVKIFDKSKTLRLEHHLIFSIDILFAEVKSAVCKLSDIDMERNDVTLYQEHSSMSTDCITTDSDTSLGEALGGQILRHGTVLIFDVISKTPAEETTATPVDTIQSVEDTTPTQSDREVLDHMRKLGGSISVTWYSTSQRYLPSNTDGDFTLVLRLDMQISDIIDRLANQLRCGPRNLKLFGARRDQGYPQLVDSSAYDSNSSESLLKIVYRQVQHSPLWRHSVVLYYQQLALSIEELAVRHTVTLSYVTGHEECRTVTVYPLMRAGEKPSTVSYLLELVSAELQTERPLRLLSTSYKRVMRMCKPELPISSILHNELRLEQIPEDEEEVESEFSEILASVTIDSAYLLKRGVTPQPFLMIIDRTDTGSTILENIFNRLNVKDIWKDKIDVKLMIPGEPSSLLPEGRLSVRHWANMAYDDDSGSYEKCNYIKITDCLR